MSSLLSYSFFITQKMKVQLHEGPVYGTLPLLYVFLARTGKVINDVTLVSLDDAGNLIEGGTDTPGRGKERRSAATGVRITFSDGDGPQQTLYYFSTDLSDGSFGRSGFATFCAKLGPADSFIKSASYLLHKSSFNGVRKFLLDHSATILQDDSGVPLAYFNRQGWHVRPFGRYAGPLSIFPGAYQSNMAELFRNATPINFGIGYRWRNNESNLLLAQKSGASTSEEVATPNSLSETAAPGTTNQPTKKTRKRVQRNATGSFGCREGGFFPFCSNSAGRRNW
jgi:hypothetical protein